MEREQEKSALIRLRGTDEAMLVVLIRTEALAGSGTDSDPYYTKEQYWTISGELLAERKV